jgi:hypothetical protein
MRRFYEDHQMKDEALKLALEALEKLQWSLEQADCSTGYCCCGSSVDGHTFGDGHSPVDEGDYCQSNALEYARKAITAIKQALALDKKAENARELGLDYEPAPVQDTEAHYKGVVEGVKKLFDDKRAQPAVPDAFGTREGEHPQYVQGWNDCRAEMLKGMK